MALSLYQGMLLKYNTPNTCDILIIPDNFIVRDARLPLTLGHQVRPKEKSILLVAISDESYSLVFGIFRDPIGFTTEQSNVRLTNTREEGQLQEGEIYFEAHGNTPTNSFISGAYLHLTNAGIAEIYSSNKTESLRIGGFTTDDDYAVVLQGTNGFFQSNIDPISQLQSVVRFDQVNTLQLGNLTAITTGASVVETIQAELKFDSSNNITLRNTVLGTDNASIKLTADGNINLNNGSLGVARLNDQVISSSIEDSAFWAMMNALLSFMTAVSSASVPEVSEIKGAAASFISSATPFPTQMTGKINQASSTVKAGG